ncbi:MAG: amidohydrolase, partial [Candidatus Cloacimonadaceae bacterium]|nr:amidohydrolase [Candidatus Cloacimonadaceae bacterium]
MITCDTLIKGGSIICMDEDFRILDHHQIAIKDGKILAISPLDDPKYSAVQELDASDCLITPGFINAHTHIPMTYFRGLA